MRSPAERTVVAAICAIAFAGAGAAWWYADHWLPHVGPWADRTWQRITRPGPETLSKDRATGSAARAGAAPPAATHPRKCVRADGHVTYTDQPCPPGSQERVVDGGATTMAPPAQR